MKTYGLNANTKLDIDNFFDTLSNLNYLNIELYKKMHI